MKCSGSTVEYVALDLELSTQSDQDSVNMVTSSLSDNSPISILQSTPQVVYSTKLTFDNLARL